MNQYSEDTGLEANPDGYVFTSGQMVEPFEEGTRALDYGQISDIVESDYGFHIILRLDPAEVELIRSDWALNQLSQQSTPYRDALNGTEESDSTSDTQDTSGSDTPTQEETSDTQADANTQEGDADTGTTDGEADAAGTGEDASGDNADSADTGDTTTE